MSRTRRDHRTTTASNDAAAARARALWEGLESRVLFADPWGPAAQLMGLDAAAADHADFTGAGQTIAVLDTGIDYRHPLLGGGFGPGRKVVGGYDFVDNDNDPMDTFGHGTKVAGVLAADAFSYQGFTYRGVAPDARLVALRIDEADEPVPDQRMERALKWVLDRRQSLGITVVNVSFGFGSYADAEVSPVFGDELKALRDAGVYVVSSSGNNGVGDEPGVQYPAADPNVWGVGAVDTFGTIAEFTQRNDLLDMLAAGRSIPTTALAGDDDQVTAVLTTASGTSFAAPMVAGAVALMRQADATLRPADIDSILRTSATIVQDGDDEFGRTTDLAYPMLNVGDALDLTVARRPGPQAPNGDPDEVAPFANSNAVSYDRDGVLHLAYYDSVDRSLKYATRATGSDRWSDVSVVDDTEEFLGQYVSLAHDRFGRPAVAYFDGDSGNLKFARFEGDRWREQTLDWKGSVGLYPTLLFDANDRPVISYYYKTGGDLRLARENANGTWSIQAIDTAGDVGRSTSMAMDADGRLAIAYENTGTGHLKVARESSPGGAWSNTVIDDSTLGVAWINLAFDRQNRPSVSYYDAHPANLKFARLDDNNTWASETLASKGAQGLYNTLAYDATGKANIVYYNRQLNETMLATGGPGSWTFNRLETGGGRYISLDLVGDDLTYTWSESGSKVLHVETV